MSAYERSGWRDEELSRRHRRWGWALPATDLDFVMVEFSVGAPVALVEYKRHDAPKLDLRHPTYQALKALADRPPAVPFFIARYWPGCWAFHVISVNDLARAVFGHQRSMSEAEYVRALYQVRHLTVQDAVLPHLNTVQPPKPAHGRLLKTY